MQQYFELVPFLHYYIYSCVIPCSRAQANYNSQVLIYTISLSWFVSGKPRPPTNVIVNITFDGYYVSWDHEPVAGRPLIKYFVLEYRKKNSFAVWTRADAMVNGDQRVYLFKADLFDPESDYDFRVYAYAKMFSEPAYVSKTNAIGKT